MFPPLCFPLTTHTVHIGATLMRPPCVRIDVVRVCVCVSPLIPPPPCAFASTPPRLFLLLLFFHLRVLFRFWCKWSAGRQAVSRPVTLAVSCRARALNPRSYFRRVRVCECVAARPPLLLLLLRVCVCYFVLCGLFALDPHAKRSGKNYFA